MSKTIDGVFWDFGPEDAVEYFDNRKSYWITKYRPINGTEGLDFNPDWFRKPAISKLKSGVYSGFPANSKSLRDYWREQKKISIDGIEINGYRLTGDNYFWLNFYNLKTSIGDTGKASAGRKSSFPTFLVFQYEYFHYVEMCEILGKDCGLLKARALGFSEMGASLCVRPYITTKNYRVVASAFSERHLSPLLNKIWLQLNWLNDNTETGFKRVRMVKDTGSFKRASTRNKEGVESGHMAEIEGIVADSAEKIRGDRTERLFYEEIGSDKLFKKKFIQGEALITVMGDRIGTRIAWGTGGDSGVAIEGIRDMVEHPNVFNVLPHKHNYTEGRKEVLTAMFIPAYRVVTDRRANLIDSRGYCDEASCIAYHERARASKIEDPKALLMFKAEQCFTIQEALIQEGDDIFPKAELADQETAITILQTVPEPERGDLVWKRGPDREIIGVFWRPDNLNGKTLIVEHPLKTSEGSSYKNLYVGGIDSIDIGTNDSSTDNKVSDFCIVIKKRNLGIADPQYVLMYKDRPKDIREAYEMAAKALWYYDCQAVLESTRTAILTYFRDHNYLRFLMRRPRATMPDVAKGNSNMYGTPTPVKVINHYRELIYDFCLDYCYTINFIDIVRQLLQYSDKNKKDFDIVAAMGMCELGDEELSNKKPVAYEKESQKFADIGWYKDSKGYKHYGKIPKTEEERNERNRTSRSESWLDKETL